MKKLLLSLLPSFLMTGCSFIMASKLPTARPPEELSKGVAMGYVDRHFGYPVAAGSDADGNYVEQLQFIDGVPDWMKGTRFYMHIVLNGCTYYLWELAGTLIELACNDYPIYVYYIVYDSDGRIVRAVPSTSDEGMRLSRLPWASPYIDDLKVNNDRRIRVRYSGQKASRQSAESEDFLPGPRNGGGKDFKRLRDAGVLSPEEF